MESGTVGRIAIFLNELVTNALKHGEGRIHVEVRDDPDIFEMAVANAGRPLSSDFRMSRQPGFGLNAMIPVAESMGAELVAIDKGRLSGAEFCLRLPARNEAATSAAA